MDACDTDHVRSFRESFYYMTSAYVQEDNRKHTSIHDLPRWSTIETWSWLVEYENPRTGNYRTSDRHSTFLSSGNTPQ